MPNTDTFKSRLERQLNAGVLRHPEALRSQAEYLQLGLLSLTEPMEQDNDWWEIRGALLAYDCDKTRPTTLNMRRN